ncbi:tripeptide permease TppB [Escherichia coli]|nr:tripeptide permease TppB [Escherichia coli]
MALGVVAFGIVVIFGKEAFAMKGAARRKMIVAFILMLEAIIFFVLYSQMPTSLNFFAIRNVEHSILGLAVEPEQYQALNPFWIIIGSPILAAIYNKMGDYPADANQVCNRHGDVFWCVPDSAAGCEIRV